jgi:sec-independent protein translocase protein TatC
VPSLHRRKADHPADGSMTLREHLYELRHRLFFAVLAIFLGAVIGFIWYSVGIPAIRLQPLGKILTDPYCAVPSPPRLSFDNLPCGLLATGPFSALHIRLSSAIMAGVLLSCPVWLYQLWAFVGPALYSKEKKFALSFVGIAAALFAGGMVLAYLVIPEGLKVLLGFGGNTVVSGLDPDQYYSFLVGLMLIFGVSLELPLLLVMLNFAGVIKGVKLAKARRYAFFGMVVFAALVVPGNDPVSMGVLALVLCILYEAAVQVTKAHDRRKGKKQAQSYAALPDDVASPLEFGTPEDAETGASVDVGTPEPVAAPAPISASEPVSGGGAVDRWTDAT